MSADHVTKAGITSAAMTAVIAITLQFGIVLPRAIRLTREDYVRQVLDI